MPPQLVRKVEILKFLVSNLTVNYRRINQIPLE
jgi:hypothetical protein